MIRIGLKDTNNIIEVFKFNYEKNKKYELFIQDEVIAILTREIAENANCNLVRYPRDINPIINTKYLYLPNNELMIYLLNYEAISRLNSEYYVGNFNVLYDKDKRFKISCPIRVILELAYVDPEKIVRLCSKTVSVEGFVNYILHNENIRKQMEGFCKSALSEIMKEDICLSEVNLIKNRLKTVIVNKYNESIKALTGFTVTDIISIETGNMTANVINQIKEIETRIKSLDSENKIKKFCPDCGKEITDSNAIFCVECGRKL